MALILKGCLQQTCDGLEFNDQTGLYNATTNPGGYGSENVVLGPSDFDTYELSLWAPDNDYYADVPAPSVTLDLLEDVPTPDPDDHYKWPFTEAQVGIPLADGPWYWEAVGVKDGDEYRTQGVVIFLNDLRASINAKLKGWDPTCPCKAGCYDIADLYAKFLVLEKGGICDPQGSIDVIKWMKAKLKACC